MGHPHGKVRGAVSFRAPPHPSPTSLHSVISRLTLAFLGVAVGVAAQSIGTPGRLSDPGLRMPAGLGVGGPAALVDLNADGLQDIVRASGQAVEVLLQRDDGRFVLDSRQPSLTFSTAATRVSALAVGDLNADGAEDVIVGLVGVDDEVLLGNGLGQLRPSATSLIPTLAGQGLATDVIGVGNIDGRGGDDLLLLSPDGNTRILLAPAQPGSPYFPAPAGVLTGRGAGPQRASAVADLDADGDLDLVCAPVGGQAVLLLENVGGTFIERNSFAYPADQIVVGEFGGGFGGDLVLFEASGLQRQPVVARAMAPFVFTPQPLGWSLPLRSVARGDFDGLSGSRLDDLAMMTADGAVQVSIDLAPPVPVGEPATRACLAVGDLEADGDDDILAIGLRPPDQIWLSDGAAAFLPTELPAIVGDAVASAVQVGVLVGQQPALDPNLAVFTPNGSVHSYLNRDGNRFGPSPRAGAPRYGGLRIEVALPAAVTAAGAADFVLLDGSQPDGLRLAASHGTGDLVDVTAAHWPIAGEWLVAVAVGKFRSSGTAPAARDDLVCADVFGNLRFFRWVTSGYREVLGAFSAGPTGGNVVQILVGDYDADGALDLFVLRDRGTDLWFGSGANLPGTSPLFDAAPAVSPSGVVAPLGLVTDVNQDGSDDVVLATPTHPSQPLSVFVSQPNRSFRDATANAFPAALPRVAVQRLVAVGEGERETLVAALASGALVKMPRDPAFSAGAAPFYGSPEALPIHGSGVIADLVVGDVDGDADEDLIVLRQDATPFLLFNREVQLSALSVVQAGRSLELVVEADPVDLGAIFFDAGPGPVRFPIPVWGVLRVASPLTLAQVQPAGGRASVRLPLPVGLAASLRFQLAIVRNAGPGPLIMFGNMIEVLVTPF